MIKPPSHAELDGKEEITVNVGDLQRIRESLENSLKIVNKYINQHFAVSKCMGSERILDQNPENRLEREGLVPKSSPKKTIDLFAQKTNTKTREDSRKISLGPCMFVQKRILTNITTREGLEDCKERCGRKAYIIKNGIILCNRHKESDTKRIEEILRENAEAESSDKDLPEGDYSGAPRPEKNSPSEDIVEILNELGKLEKLIDENKFTPCRIRFKDTCMVTSGGNAYVVDPCGDCFGKISDKEVVEDLERKAKMKEYFDVEHHISALKYSDMGFLEEFKLCYIKPPSS